MSHEPWEYVVIRLVCPSCGWDRTLTLRPQQTKVDCPGCSYVLSRDEAIKMAREIERLEED